jgi:hypothetical protein
MRVDTVTKHISKGDEAETKVGYQDAERQDKTVPFLTILECKELEQRE